MLTFLDKQGNEIGAGDKTLDAGVLPLGGDMMADGMGLLNDDMFEMDWGATVGPEAGLVDGNGIPGWS